MGLCLGVVGLVAEWTERQHLVCQFNRLIVGTQLAPTATQVEEQVDLKLFEDWSVLTGECGRQATESVLITVGSLREVILLEQGVAVF